MKISIIDAGNYYRGLLLLIRKDRKVTHVETELMLRIGQKLGFERGFCENAIREILENQYITETPPEFSTKDLARKFVHDGLAIIFADGEVHPDEEHWLLSTAEKNGLDREFYLLARGSAMERWGMPARLEVDDMLIQHS